MLPLSSSNSNRDSNVFLYGHDGLIRILSYVRVFCVKVCTPTTEVEANYFIT